MHELKKSLLEEIHQKALELDELLEQADEFGVYEQASRLSNLWIDLDEALSELVEH